jgi:hypothetical protein
MRTTLTIEDSLARELKEAAHKSGKSFKEVVNEALRAGLRVGKTPPRAKPYRLKSCSLGGAHPGINLDKALRLADEVENEEIARKLAMKK